ncbi:MULTISPECIES: pyridoxamine 5'-phosphate oxidase family protein [unclassified Microbacterium]|uniref:pyridoxamine 5'-phosphate oxidase family protein n=1 Tax=unclassified Microbacterium TaxID=2609290 RepID=UPI003657CAAD
MTAAHAPAHTRFADALDATQAQSLREILGAGRLLSLSTVTRHGEAHINTAFFTFSDDFTLYLLSPPSTEHARNAAANPSAAIAVFDSHQTHATRRGAQLFGRLDEIQPEEAESALACFRDRFPDVAEPGQAYGDFARARGVALYAFRPTRAKLFDEALLITDGYVEVALDC